MRTSGLKINDKKTANLLAWLCALTYLGSYLTRVNFGAVTVEIINSMGWEKSAISAVTTALFITYGTGQLVSGKLCDKYDPHLQIHSFHDRHLGCQWLCTSYDVASHR